jgi:hypothetical protein
LSAIGLLPHDPNAPTSGLVTDTVELCIAVLDAPRCGKRSHHPAGPPARERDLHRMARLDRDPAGVPGIA